MAFSVGPRIVFRNADVLQLASRACSLRFASRIMSLLKQAGAQIVAAQVPIVLRQQYDVSSAVRRANYHRVKFCGSLLSAAIVHAEPSPPSGNSLMLFTTAAVHLLTRARDTPPLLPPKNNALSGFAASSPKALASPAKPEPHDIRSPEGCFQLAPTK